jgi:PBP1b-binding outer membrane lipoprotein LpoB
MSAMRIAILLVVLALAACGKKKAPQSPAPESKEMTEGKDEKDVNAPAEGDDPKDTRSSDPQEGGE